MIVNKLFPSGIMLEFANFIKQRLEHIGIFSGPISVLHCIF